MIRITFHQKLFSKLHEEIRYRPGSPEAYTAHGHKAVSVGSNEWYFHNYENGYKHCKGGGSNPYELKHDKNGKHLINKEFARGHGRNRKPTWFHFKESTNNGWWRVDSGL